MPELTILPCVHSRLDSNTFTMGRQPHARVDLNLCQSRLYPPERDFEFGLWEAYFCSIIMTEIRKGENETIHVLENVGMQIQKQGKRFWSIDQQICPGGGKLENLRGHRV
jgi:hypothetical protein